MRARWGEAILAFEMLANTAIYRAAAAFERAGDWTKILLLSLLTGPSKCPFPSRKHFFWILPVDRSFLRSAELSQNF
jgi:hypothetical protein